MLAIEGERGRSYGIIYKSQYVKHSEGSGGNRFDHLNTTWKENNASDLLDILFPSIETCQLLLCILETH
jgi:hypothetical protein